MSETLKVVKIGGKVAENDEKLVVFLDHFVQLEGPKILVHGGGAIATEIGKKLEIEPNLINGRRVTDSETLDLVLMVYAGLVNKKIVASLQAKGVNSVGLTGADLNLIQSKKREVNPIDFGWVGDIEKVNGGVLSGFLEDETVPVLVPLTHDGMGNMLNTNADSIAAFTAIEMGKSAKTELIFCFEQQGVMNNGAVIGNLNPETYEELKKQEVITAGMIPKLDSGYKALQNGVFKVKICAYDEISTTNTGTNLKLN